MNHQALSSFIWSVADLLRGDFKQSEYGRVILPFTVLRRLDCVLEATKPAVLAEFDAKTKAGLNPEPFLLRKAGQSFFNTSPLELGKLLGDQDHIRQNLYAYVQAFSPAARDIFERFDFHAQVERWPRRTCCTWSQKSSPTSTCTPRWSTTPAWARCSKS
jgi:type I restriction enzyme M protein